MHLITITFRRLLILILYAFENVGKKLPSAYIGINPHLNENVYEKTVWLIVHILFESDSGAFVAVLLNNLSNDVLRLRNFTNTFFNR